MSINLAFSQTSSQEFEGDTDRETSPEPLPIRIRANVGQPLRRTGMRFIFCPGKAYSDFLSLETTIEDLLPQKMKPVSDDDLLRMTTSDSDVEMESEEDQEPTPRPRKNRNRSPTPSAEEIDLEEDEHFKTPRSLKKRKPATEVVTMETSELSGSEESEESEEENNRKKTKTGAKGKEGYRSTKVTINLPDFFDVDEELC